MNAATEGFSSDRSKVSDPTKKCEVVYTLSAKVRIWYEPAGVRDTFLYQWSADRVDPKHRFDEWREVRSKGLFGVTAELEPEQRGQFFGDFKLQKFGHAGLIELRASPYRVMRTARDIGEAPGDSLCIYQQLSEGGRFDTGDGSDFTVRRAAFATSFSDLPYRTSPVGADGFHLRVIKIPLAGIDAPRGGLHDLFPKPFDSDPVVAPLLQSCFADLVAAGESMAPPASATLVQALASLVLIGRGKAPPGSAPARQALRVGRLSLARRIIASQFANVHLSPVEVAGQLGISVRHLHVLFESTGMSFSQTLTAIRLEQSRKLLLAAPERAIASVAFACGFESLATFYRLFRAGHGMPPGDFRDTEARSA
jgi:AraC-like DNA-binding protein